MEPLRNIGWTTEAAKEAAAKEWNEKNPDAEIQVGWFIKKKFTHGGRNEHMWVEVTGEGTGTLNNDPAIVPMRCGQKVTWKREEIQALLPPF